jgi:hypothetical protein
MMTIKPDRTEVMGILAARVTAVDLDAPTGKVSDQMSDTTIKRLKDEDK